MKEAQIQEAILAYLTVKGILAFRMNTGAFKVDHRFIRCGSPGMADILAFVPKGAPLWIEVKSDTGKQSTIQKWFQEMVEGHGHAYIVARSIEDVQDILTKWD